MKKLLLLACLISQALFAQQIEVKSIEQLKGTESGGHFHPKFSPKGTWLLTTLENYTGLQKISLETNEKTVLTKDAGAGYEANISPDESEILYKKTEFVDNVRYSSLYKYSVPQKQGVKLEKGTREKISSYYDGNRASYIKGSILKKDPQSTKNGSSSAPYINIEDQKMVLYKDNTKKILTPNGEKASYFWASVSPDQKHIVYTIAIGGTFVCDINGSNVKSLGVVNAPVWLNDQWIVGMDDKDNGDFVTSSEIVVATIDGKIRQTLATPLSKIAMYPSASADGDRIAFNTDKGVVYLMDIKIK